MPRKRKNGKRRYKKTDPMRELIHDKRDIRKMGKWRERIRKKYRFLKDWQKKHDISPVVFCNMTSTRNLPSIQYFLWIEKVLTSEGL